MSDQWFAASYVALWVVVIVLVVLILALSRELGQLYLRTPGGMSRDGPKVGASLTSLTVESGAIELIAGRHMLIFGLQTCRVCEELAPGLSELIASGTASFDLHFLVSRVSDAPDSHAPWVDSPRLATQWIASSVPTRLGIRVSPFAVYVVDGVVRAKGVVNRPNDVLAMSDERAMEGAAV